MACYECAFLKQFFILNSITYKAFCMISPKAILIFDTSENSNLLTEPTDVKKLIKLNKIFINNWLAKKKDLFSLKVLGDSMNRVLSDGSITILQKTNVLDNENIRAILVNGYDATIKMFFKLNDSIILEPLSFNPDQKPIIIENGQETVCPSVNFSGIVYRGIFND